VADHSNDKSSKVNAPRRSVPGANGQDAAAARAAFVAPFAELLAQVDGAREASMYPLFPCVEPAATNGKPGPIVLVANDYLGLSQDARVRRAAQAAIEQFGTSRCASPLAGGYTRLHRALEADLADFLEQEAAVLFASGYQANVGIISGLMRQGDLILTDLLNHASIIDGARLSGADVRFFRHNDAAHLERIVRRLPAARRVLVILEGIYSADGDVGLLADLCAVAHHYGALVMVDEAHSLGVLGAHGRGAAEHFGLLRHVDVIMGTMSKSLASVGGFAAADARLIDVIRHQARALIFSAALPPAGVAAAHTALGLLRAEPERRERLWRNARFFVAGLRARGFDTMGSETPVIPMLIGDELRTIALTARLREREVLVCPAISPMVRAHLSRIRAHVTAAHDEAVLGRGLDVIDDEARTLGIISAPSAHAAAQA
jgi:8-amino-7-oxononanoate synthase